PGVTEHRTLPAVLEREHVVRTTRRVDLPAQDRRERAPGHRHHLAAADYGGILASGEIDARRPEIERRGKRMTASGLHAKSRRTDDQRRMDAALRERTFREEVAGRAGRAPAEPDQPVAVPPPGVLDAVVELRTVVGHEGAVVGRAFGAVVGHEEHERVVELADLFEMAKQAADLH